jgi:hypothetical protein
MRNIVMAILLSACAAEPSISAVNQQLCQIDPITGACPGLIEEAQADSSAQALSDNPEYTNADAAACTDRHTVGPSRYTITCGVGLSAPGIGGMAVACTVDYEVQPYGQYAIHSIVCVVVTN